MNVSLFTAKFCFIMQYGSLGGKDALLRSHGNCRTSRRTNGARLLLTIQPRATAALIAVASAYSLRIASIGLVCAALYAGTKVDASATGSVIPNAAAKLTRS